MAVPFGIMVRTEPQNFRKVLRPQPYTDIAEYLFDPFISGRPEGQGLGLALVDKLMRDMGGIVQYAREGLPEMTTLRLLLPRAAQ